MRRSSVGVYTCRSLRNTPIISGNGTIVAFSGPGVLWEYAIVKLQELCHPTMHLFVRRCSIQSFYSIQYNSTLFTFQITRSEELDDEELYDAIYTLAIVQNHLGYMVESCVTSLNATT